MIMGTACAASVVTESECIIYSLSKAVYSHVVSRYAPEATSLLPPSSVNVVNHDRLPTIQKRIFASLRDEARIIDDCEAMRGAESLEVDDGHTEHVGEMGREGGGRT